MRSRDRILVFPILLLQKPCHEKKRKSMKEGRKEETRRKKGGSGELSWKNRQAFQDLRVELRDPGDSCVSRVSELDTKMMIKMTNEGSLRKRLNGSTPSFGEKS